MSLNVGTAAAKAYIGTTAATKIYLGSTLAWQGSSPLAQFRNSMTGFPNAYRSTNNTTDLANPTGQTIKWELSNTGLNIGAGTFGQAYWCDQGVDSSNSGRRAAYAVSQLPQKVMRGRGEFSFYDMGNGQQPTGTFCLAVLNQDPQMPTAPTYSTLNMSCHFRITRAGWAYTIWNPNVGEQELASGTFSPMLSFNTKYSAAFQIVGNTAYYRVPGLGVQQVTHSNIGNYGGQWCFSESYQPDKCDIVAVYNWEFDTDTDMSRLTA